MDEASAALKREAYSVFERMLGLDAESLKRELADLQGSNPALYPRVISLLEADQAAKSGRFAVGAGLRVLQVEAQPSNLSEGASIGPYRLERALGSGGMGEVWLARRTDGLFTAAVALKMLHAHLTQSTVRERFLREGRILGELTHPHVAHLLDAGISESGQPYLAIEYIEGERIDRWCDAQRLDVNARLQLFLQVCEAVAHAHAHLVVHRDLKPSNILVTADAGIKLLDFGIAKLLEVEQLSAAETELTRVGGRALTPEYAAPEQITSGTITTATDVYALGVILYGLLSGCRPYGAPTDTAAQIEREVLDTEPVPLSRSRPAQSTLEEIAARRATTSRRLRETLRGDLDTIVGKALKKAPAERYATVLALADDLRRYLANEPVLAQRDSFRYRARKYLRRHRVGVAAGAAIAVAVVAGVAGTLWQARQARNHAQAALEQAERVKRTKDFFVSIFQNINPQKRKDQAPVTVADALDDALKRVDTELASDPRLQGDLLDDLGEIRGEQGDMAGAKLMFERALALHERTLPADDPAIANSLANLGWVEYEAGNTAKVREDYGRAIAILQKHADTEADALNNARIGLASADSDVGDYPGALELLNQSLAYYRQAPEADKIRLANTLSSRGIVKIKLGRFDDARPDLEESAAIIETNLGLNSPVLFHSLDPLTFVTRHTGDVKAEVAYAERNLALVRANFKGDHTWVAKALLDLGQARLAQKRTSESEELLRESIAMFERIGGDPAFTSTALSSLAESRQQAGDDAEALSTADRGLVLCAKLPAAGQANGDCPALQATRAQAMADLRRKE